jgi:pyruvate ferredoxin oxidoreductase beta subunit
MKISPNERLSSGHATCAGCLIPTVVRTILSGTEDELVVSAATGCLEVTTTIYPNTSWRVPFIHSAFGNAAATTSGIESAYNVLLRKGKFPKDKKVQFVTFGGDGGTYDIGLQALSGALERGHDFLYVCYDNGAYMNTGNQRSGATPFAADTETTPSGRDSFGKPDRRKDIMDIVAAHHVAYAATANPAFMNDFKQKVRKAFNTRGPKFLLVFSACVNQWKYPANQGIDISKLATETNFWPLYEIEDGVWKLTYRPKTRVMVEDFLKTQGRFRHIFKRNDAARILHLIQEEVDWQWEKINRRERCD